MVKLFPSWEDVCAMAWFGKSSRIQGSKNVAKREEEAFNNPKLANLSFTLLLLHFFHHDEGPSERMTGIRARYRYQIVTKMGIYTNSNDNLRRGQAGRTNVTTGWRASFAAAPSLLCVNNNKKQGKTTSQQSRKKKHSP